MAAKPPARSATSSASRDERRAAPATRTFARTLTHMPTYPESAEHPAPSTNATVVRHANEPRVTPAATCASVSLRKE